MVLISIFWSGLLLHDPSQSFFNFVLATTSFSAHSFHRITLKEHATETVPVGCMLRPPPASAWGEWRRSVKEVPVKVMSESDNSIFPLPKIQQSTKSPKHLPIPYRIGMELFVMKARYTGLASGGFQDLKPTRRHPKAMQIQRAPRKSRYSNTAQQNHQILLLNKTYQNPKRTQRPVKPSRWKWFSWTRIFWVQPCPPKSSVEQCSEHLGDETGKPSVTIVTSDHRNKSETLRNFAKSNSKRTIGINWVRLRHSKATFTYLLSIWSMRILFTVSFGWPHWNLQVRFIGRAWPVPESLGGANSSSTFVCVLIFEIQCLSCFDTNGFRVDLRCVSLHSFASDGCFLEPQPLTLEWAPPEWEWAKKEELPVSLGCLSKLVRAQDVGFAWITYNQQALWLYNIID